MEAVDQFLAREGADAITCLPETIIPDLNRAPSIAAHKAELVRGERVQYHLAVLAQHRHIAALNRIEHAYREGFGRRVASVHPKIGEALALEYGPGWFRDRKLLYRVLKENPCLAVNCRPPKTRVLVDGFKDKFRGSAGRQGARKGAANGERARGHQVSPHVTSAAASSSKRLEAERLEERYTTAPYMADVLEAMGV